MKPFSVAKHLMRRLANRAGFDVVKYVAPIGSRSVRTDALTFHETATGRYYVPADAPGDYIAHAIRGNQIFEKEVVEIARQYIKPGTAALDVGANFGQMSVLFSNMVGPDGKVYSFDADDFVFGILKKNIEANDRINRIQPIFGAVHNVANETLYFPVQDFKRYGSYGSYGIDYNTTKGRPVPSLTIDSLNIEEPISFMKVDIQGGDLQAMQGARRTIEQNKMPIIFEFEGDLQDDFKLSFQEYVDFVRDIGYRFARVSNGHNYLILPA